jgi:hypothetical protein
VQYRLFVDLEAIQFLASSKPFLRRKLVAYLSKIEAFPESSSDYFENDSKGRQIDIAICSGSAICPATIKNGFWRQLEMTPDDN